MRNALPHASFIGFTGTPIEKPDPDARAAFGHYICIYDIQRVATMCSNATIDWALRNNVQAQLRGESPQVQSNPPEARKVCS